MGAPRILVTRPEPQATQWVQALRQHGLDAHALPLIAITAPADPTPVRALWQQLSEHRLLMFVSPAAVQWFFHLRPANARWPDTTLAAAPGPGTATQLVEAGKACGLTAAHVLSPHADADQFDSESLWPVLAPLSWQGQQVTIISGGDTHEAQGRTWLAERLREHGASVQPMLCYQRGPGCWSADHQALALAAVAQPRQHVWLFSSSQGIDHLSDHHLPLLGLPQAPHWALAQALSTHPRITERAHRLGIQDILESRPTLPAVVAALRPQSASQAGVDTIKTL